MEKKRGILLSCAFSLCAIGCTIVLQACMNYSREPERTSDPGNEVVIAWNQMAYAIANQHDQFYSFIGVRALAMTHLAMHDALNAIDPKFETYVWKGTSSGADAITATSQAAYEILSSIYPAKEDTLKKELERWLKTIKESTAKTTGSKLGQQCAKAILELRNEDGHAANATYAPRKQPGAYQFTPGFTTVWKPDLSIARPFGLESVSQFRSPPPPALSSQEYATDYEEVKAIGGKNSTLRTTVQTHTAHWWAEFGEHGWNRIGRITAAHQQLPAHETARMFALINMTLYDLYLASFDSKYTYDTWRPYTAIRHANTDSNPATVEDATWEPEMLTPPWPEYPSAHAAVGAAEAEIVSQVYGTSHLAFEMESVTALPDAKTRSYSNLDSAANDCSDSRILNGYHFRFSTEEGQRQGRKIAKYISENYLRPGVF